MRWLYNVALPVAVLFQIAALMGWVPERLPFLWFFSFGMGSAIGLLVSVVVHPASKVGEPRLLC